MEPIRLELSSPPVIGLSSTGQETHLGGFAGLRFLGRTPTGLYQFVTHTDRGPGGAWPGERPRGVAELNPHLVFLDADPKRGKVFVRSLAPLTHRNGRRLISLPREGGEGIDLQDQPVEPELAVDLEGVAIAADGTFWLCDEHGPSLIRFSADGVMLDQLSPGKELPEPLRHRRPKRGFSGLAIVGGKMIAALESPLDNPPSPEFESSRRSRITRLVEVDSARRVATAQYAYLLEEADTGGISDLCPEGPESLLAIERGASWRRLYRVRLAAATNLQRLPGAISGPGGKLETLSPRELGQNGVAPVRKFLQLELSALGRPGEIFEGVDRVDDKFIALLTDNRSEPEAPTALYFVPLLRGK